MTLIVAGTVRAPPGHIARLRAPMLEMVSATRAEDGCIEYAYAEDLLEPGLIRVVEIWRDEAALGSHFRSAHMARWREAWPSFEVTDRRLSLFRVTQQRPL
ncbi:MAG TPA: putative quinol monooxygenase [Caulobacteraceae bacterium]